MNTTTTGAVLVDGRYRIEVKIGSGGHADVYRALDEQTLKTVALKIPRSSLISDPLSAARFVREAKTTAALDHPNIVKLLAVGEAEFGPYLVVEYLEGTPLSDIIAEGTKFSSTDAATLMLPTVSALALAHDEGIVHRDFKPANIFLVAGHDGTITPKVVDFGLARPLVPIAHDRSHRTNEMVISGTPIYMSPERVRVESHGDFASDVWSIGVVLFELVAGQTPFHDTSVARLFGRIATEEPPTLESVVPEVDRGLALIVHKCLRRDPALRYETARGVEQDLQFMLRAGAQLSIKTATLQRGALKRDAGPVAIPSIAETITVEKP
jgi:serine/threonine-protein kinase